MLSESLRVVRGGRRRQVKYVSERSCEKTQFVLRNKFRNQWDTGEPVTAQKPVFIRRISAAMITRFVKAAFCRKLRWYRD